MSVFSRREQIIRLLKSTPHISNSELAQVLGVSRVTIRRDLIVLEKSGMISRDSAAPMSPQTVPAPEQLPPGGEVSAQRRRRHIARLVAERGAVRTRELSVLLGVSAATVRADLAALEADGQIRRRHGGAAPSRAPASDPLMSALTGLAFSPSVRKVGERALSHVERGDLLFLDDSLFCAYMAVHLSVEAGADIMTSSLRVALTLAQRRYGGEVFMLPGGVQTDSVSVDHPFLAAMAERFLIGRAFLALPSYSRERGFFAESPAHGELLSAIVSISQSVYLLLESRHVGRNGKYAWSPGSRQHSVAEVCVDDGLSVEAAAREFPEEVPVVLCSESYAIKSPFNKQYVVGFAALHGRSEFSRLVREGIEQAAARRSNIELIVADNKMDRQTTLANVDVFVENRVDLVIEYQHDHGLGTLIGEKTSRAGIPVIAVDIPIPGAVYFGAHDYQAGVLGGKAAAEEVRARWDGTLDNLIVVVDSAAGPLPEKRITGMVDAFLGLVPFPRQRIIRIESGNDPDVVASELAVLLSRIAPRARNLVFSMNSQVTEGILRAVAAQGRAASTLIAGQNVTPRIEQELACEESPLIGAVAYYPEQYGERIMQIAERLLENKPVDPDNYTDHRWIGRQKGGSKRHRSPFDGDGGEPAGGSDEG